MKYRISIGIFGVFCLAFLFNSCTKDFLDVKPVGKMAEEDFYKTDEDAMAAVISAYDILQWANARDWNSAYLAKTLPSDESFAGGGNAGDQVPYQELDVFTYGAGNSVITSVFESNYYGIYRANKVINNVEPETDARKNIIAEAKALRAYFYFELVSMFGDVPMMLEEPVPSEYGQPTVPAADIYALIEQDLTEAIAVLPLKSEYMAGDEFRCSKGMAQSLLGKAYLYQEKWADAATILDQVIESGEYDLEGDYSTLFLKETEFGVESIFEVSYSSDMGYDWGTFQWGGNRAMENNIHWQLCGPRGDYLDPGTTGLIGGWGFNNPTAECWDPFIEAGDTVRRKATLISVEELEAAGGSWSNPDAWGYDGYFRIKYSTIADETSVENGAVDALNYGTNLRLLRFGDVLLMAAEAHYNNGASGTAETYINRVRERANLGPVSGDLFDAIVLERQCELAFEGVRFLDLVRWGMAKDVLAGNGFQQNKNELYPIPLDELTNNPNATQNEGYSTGE